jgi:hypothetical protein
MDPKQDVTPQHGIGMIRGEQNPAIQASAFAFLVHHTSSNPLFLWRESPRKATGVTR